MTRSRPRSYLTPGEVAELLMVSPVTVRQWASKGQLNAQTTAGGHRRFLWREVERFARRRGLALALPDSDGLKVLVVDDNRAVAESIAAALAQTAPDVKVELALDGFEAGRQVNRLQPHVILLDLVMQGLDGFEVCSRLKADPATKATRVIAMTADKTARSEARILECGAEVCLSKPLVFEELLERLGIG